MPDQYSEYSGRFHSFFQRVGTELGTEVIEKVEEFEPRVSVRDVSFSYEGGTAQIIVLLEKGSGDSG